jgi:amino acid transporter
MAAAEATGGSHLRSSSIGLWDVVFQSITYMAPGVGLVFSIGIGIGFAGVTLPLSVVIGLIGCTFTAVAIGQVAKYVPSAGGIYTYVARGLNPSLGFYVGWLYVGFAAFLPVFVLTLNGFLIDDTLKRQGWWTGSPGWWFWTLLTTAVVFCLTYFDVRLSGKSGIILGACEIAIFVALGAYMIVKGHNSVDAFTPSKSVGHTKGLFIGGIYAILAFIGFEAAANLGEEARDPRRSVPRGVLYSCVGVGIYYVFTAYAWDAGTHFDIVKHYTDNAGNSWVPLGKQYWSSGWVLVFFALVNSNIACGTAAVTNAARVLFSMGRTGSAPAVLGKVHPHHRTPYVAVVTCLSIETVIGFLTVWKFGADLAYAIVGTGFTVLAIFIYLLACVGCIGYLNGEGREHRNWFLHVVCPVAGILVFLVALYANYFSFDTLFKWTPAYPFNWPLIGAIIWLLVGIGITLYMRSAKPAQLEAATQIFGGEEVSPIESVGVPQH